MHRRPEAGQHFVASALYLSARLVHSLAYLSGITIIRSAAFYAGAIACLVILYQLPLF